MFFVKAYLQQPLAIYLSQLGTNTWRLCGYNSCPSVEITSMRYPIHQGSPGNAASALHVEGHVGLRIGCQTAFENLLRPLSAAQLSPRMRNSSSLQTFFFFFLCHRDPRLLSTFLQVKWFCCEIWQNHKQMRRRRTTGGGHGEEDRRRR